MTFNFAKELRRHVEWAEGRRQFPYEDSVGKVTIGVGRNLDDRGLSHDEIDMLLRNDLDLAFHDANKFDWFDKLDPVRQLVVVDMIFNLGKTRFTGFINTIAAIKDGHYVSAALEMQDSKWYRQTGRRARRLVAAMRTGVWK